MLLDDAEMRSAAADLLNRAVPEIRLVLQGSKGALSRNLEESILELLTVVSTKASPALKASLETLMADIEEGVIEELLKETELSGRKKE